MNTRKLFYLVSAWVMALAPLASAQSTSWTHQFGTAADDFAFGVAIDSAGVYSAGYTGNVPASALVCQTNNGNSNSFVKVYDPVNNIDTTLATGNFEVGRSVAVYAGGVYSAGFSQGTGTAVVRKADPGGWTDIFADPSQAYAVAVDGSGVYAAGFIIVSGDIQAFVRKYNFSGSIQWTEVFGTTSTDVAIGLTLNGTSLYVTGYTQGALAQPNAGGGDVFVRKYDISGATPVASWTKQFGTSANDAAFSAASDGTGVYLAGCTSGTAGTGDVCASDADAFVRKLNPDGSNAWFSQFGTALSFDSALGVAVNGTGVYVSGYTDGQLPGQTAQGNSDAFLAKYSLTGTPLWTNQFGTSSADLAWGVAADPSGAVVAGCTAGTLPGQTSSGGSDAYIAKNPAITVGIDIRPGASPNNINLGSNGVVQVAILSSATFDATTVDPMSVTLAGASVKLKGNGTAQTIQQDVNGDGRMDLIVQVNTSALQLSSTDTTATLTGMTFAGEAFQGTDVVRIVPN